LVIELSKPPTDKVNEEDDEFLIIDEWDINSPNSRYKRFIMEAFFELMRPHIYVIRAKHCEGCIESYPSQLHHCCLTGKPDEVTDLIFPDLFEIVNEKEANEQCKKKENYPQE